MSKASGPIAEIDRLPEDAAVAAKALLRAASRLGLSNRALGKVIGLSEASVSRMGKGAYALRRDDKSFELGLLFVRLFRALDAIVGGDEATARVWLRNENLALGGRPLELIQTVPGLVNVLAYLDARRALV
ncbi:MAG TPA: MbcA/ParS/Xre antitoxin family protein [Gammaproteobacteria bacterium]